MSFLYSRDLRSTISDAAPFTMIHKPVRNVVIPTEYGNLIVNRFDNGPGFRGVGGELLDTGTYMPSEMELIRSLVSSLPQNPVVLDVGANIGVTTLVMAEACARSNGTVLAFEPQRIIFQMLCGNLALNNIDNVIAHQAALGSTTGHIEVPQLNYYSHASFGSLELGAPQREDIGQVPRVGLSSEQAPIYPLDSLHLSRIDFVKIDVEGMELTVLQGAHQTFHQTRPLVLIEWIKTGEHALRHWFGEQNYRIATVGQNLVCIPGESPLQIIVT
jgi:FkbM family methyltransferase